MSKMGVLKYRLMIKHGAVGKLLLDDCNCLVGAEDWC